MRARSAAHASCDYPERESMRVESASDVSAVVAALVRATKRFVISNPLSMNDRRVTLADIAVQAKVHVTTVSLALRNHPRLPSTTRERIQSLAKDMGYAPDPFLRALVAYRGKIMPRRDPPTLAYITHWNTRWGWQKVTAHPQFYAGAERKAQELGFRLEHFWLGEPGLSHSRLNSILQARAVNGIVVASHIREADEALNLEWSRFSAVKIDYLPHKPALHNVTNDQCSIIRLAMRQVRAAGYRRIGFVMDRGWDHSVDHLWTAGYLCEQQTVPQEHRIPMFLFPEVEPTTSRTDETKAATVAPAEAFRKWYRDYRPEVIISKASFVKPRLAEMGLRVPQDVAFADVFLETFDGKIAGVRQNHETVGEVTVEILAGQLQHNKYGVPDIATTTFVEGTWFNGASCPPRG